MILLRRKTHRVAEFAKSLYKTNFNRPGSARIGLKGPNSRFGLNTENI